MNILIVGANGLIGSTVFRVLSENQDWKVFGSIRTEQIKSLFSKSNTSRLVAGGDAESDEALIKLLDQVKPNLVINCAGLTKHRPSSHNMANLISINAVMPHRLAEICKIIGARLIHISTDCVFCGAKGNYKESDVTDSKDSYGKSKALGEVIDSENITIRTSTIGHELKSNYGLLEWFLSQSGQCTGYRRAIFSGMPTVVFAQVLRDKVIPNPNLTGLYHVAAQPINKFDLLELLAKMYGKTIRIVPDEEFAIDRSLNSTNFSLATGYIAPSWHEMVAKMLSYR